ncbi:MAG: hypothetical protein HC780_27825 [Leptolyngbyaceae cyanobacterium CSU_1_3]|nr:hypothetical protein [Leptolyngbyaceae cyanobacterium CSU_1_3]
MGWLFFSVAELRHEATQIFDFLRQATHFSDLAQKPEICHFFIRQH